MSTETAETTTSKPGRKPGAMQRDEQGRLLKKDGTLAKTPGRKKGSTSSKKGKATAATKTKRKPGRPAKNKNTRKKTTVQEGRVRKAPPKASKLTPVDANVKRAFKKYMDATQNLINALM
jgi:hypothetical protein